MEGPWCFTKNKNVPMELCDIPSCSKYSLSHFLKSIDYRVSHGTGRLMVLGTTPIPLP